MFRLYIGSQALSYGVLRTVMWKYMSITDLQCIDKIGLKMSFKIDEKYRGLKTISHCVAVQRSHNSNWVLITYSSPLQWMVASHTSVTSLIFSYHLRQLLLSNMHRNRKKFSAKFLWMKKGTKSTQTFMLMDLFFKTLSIIDTIARWNHTTCSETMPLK